MNPFLRIAVFTLVGCAAWADGLPDPAVLTQQFEAQERERAINRRIEFQIARAPKPVPAPAPAPRTVTDQQRDELIRALDVYMREHGGRLPVLWSPPEVK